MSILVQFLIIVSLLATITSSLRVYPHELTYFNEFAGGPAHADRHLLGSNLDWGQDLVILAEWCQTRPDTDEIFVEVRSFGSDLESFGIPAEPPPRASGWQRLKHSGEADNASGQMYVISRESLGRRQCSLNSEHMKGNDRSIERDVIDYLLHNEPAERIGNTLLVFRMQDIRDYLLKSNGSLGTGANE